MRLVGIIIVVFALVLSGVVFLAVPRLMGTGQPAAPSPAQVIQAAGQDVLVASHSLPAGTVLKSDDVRWQRWPLDAIDPSFLVREKGADPQRDAVGLMVVHGIEQGEPVTAFRVMKPGDAGFLAAALAPGKRAVTLAINPLTSEAGFILPLDRVDIVLIEHYAITPAAVSSQAGASPPQVTTKDISTVLMSDVKVLAIDQGMQDIDSKPRLGSTATLEVDLKQAQKLQIAASLGTLSLVLRSLRPAIPPETDPTGPASIVEDFQVSPYRAALLAQSMGGAQGPTASIGGGMLRVYHGASLLAGSK
jgi:pilus assembly protein CpaB